MTAHNRHTLARCMAAQVDGLTVQMAAAALDAFVDIVVDTVSQGGSVRLTGFGSFGLRHRKSRQALHPRTRQPVHIPEAYLMTFTPSARIHQAKPGE